MTLIALWRFSIRSACSYPLAPMRRTLPLLAILLIALLAAPASAPAIVGGAGHNKPTKNLEAAYKIALYLRSVSADGCYPPPRKLRQGNPQAQSETQGARRTEPALGPPPGHRLHPAAGLELQPGPHGLAEPERSLRPRLRLGKHQGARKARPANAPGQSGPARQVRLVSRSFRLQGPDDTQRLDTLCPRRSFPLGGGMIASPGPSANGEGAYPHSYERLGAQRGWHINVILYDPNRSSTTPRDITIQTVCGRFLRPSNPTPHATIFIKSGETKIRDGQLPQGPVPDRGRLRTAPTSTAPVATTSPSPARTGRGPGGSRGSAFGGSGGGELTAIAYCVKHRGPILTEVSASAPVPFGATATATTPPCPPGLRLTSTGFSASPSALFAGSSLNPDGTSTGDGGRPLRRGAEPHRVRLLPAGEALRHPQALSRMLTMTRQVRPLPPGDDLQRRARTAVDDVGAAVERVQGAPYSPDQPHLQRRRQERPAPSARARIRAT